MKDTSRENYASEATACVTLPVVEEQLDIGKQVVESGKVSISKTVEKVPELVDMVLEKDEINVERVPIGQVIEGELPGVREESGVTIIPVFEEELVLQKRIVLKEEIHITRNKREVQTSQNIVLQKERVTVDRTK